VEHDGGSLAALHRISAENGSTHSSRGISAGLNLLLDLGAGGG